MTTIATPCKGSSTTLEERQRLKTSGATRRHLACDQVPQGLAAPRTVPRLCGVS